ncbi:hypothetical protein MPLA_140346 [Mesorhizobium sp. ORS 3359]|nr:hypothetical protein MPLA_140346 [Mesorhizobium sp. ORS 3359]
MTDQLSTLDQHRSAIADILAYLASHGLAAVMLSPEKIEGSPLQPDVFVDLVRWLENEGVIRVSGNPALRTGSFPKAQLTAVGLKILGLEILIRAASPARTGSGNAAFADWPGCSQIATMSPISG